MQCTNEFRRPARVHSGAAANRPASDNAFEVYHADFSLICLRKHGF
jgi:hypothetical protein